MFEENPTIDNRSGWRNLREYQNIFQIGMRSFKSEGKVSDRN